MSDDSKWLDGLKVLTAAGLLLAGVAACDGELLDVQDPDNVQPSEEFSPTDVSPRLAGMVNEFRNAYDDYVLYTGLLTDEFILAGTFPTRREVDRRQPISQNVSINADVWEPLSVTRAVADQNLADFQAALGTDEFSGQTSNLQTGISWGNLIAGYSRLFLAELFCHSILGGGPADIPRFVEDETVEEAPLGTADRAREALDYFEDAEANAADFGNEEVRLAALVGQARSHMLLYSLTGDAQHLTDANDAASEVWMSNDDFVSAVEYASASTAEENDVHQVTWGVNASLRWTVGDGSDGSRGNERFAYFGEVNYSGGTNFAGSTGWVGEGLVIPPVVADEDADDAFDGVIDGPGLGAFNGVSPVAAQTVYAGRSGALADVSIPLATSWEARMIMAEVALRPDGPNTPADAETFVNDLLPDVSRNPITSVNAGLTTVPGSGDFTSERLEGFPTISLDDGESLEENLADLAFAYEAGLWMTSHRHHYLRRMAEEFDDRFFPRTAVGDNYGDPSAGGNAKNFPVAASAGSLWPDHGEAGSDAITLPVPAAEVDNNDNIGSACPAGYP